ncbi:MAG: DUF4294 domain-containing protein [Bacteroidota bacterium]
MKRFISSIVLITLFICGMYAHAQEPVVARAIIIDGDTLPIIALDDVRIYGPIIFKSKHEAIKFTRLIRDVKIVYPYARVVGVKVKEYNDIIEQTSSRKEKKQKMNVAEDELKSQFEADIKNLTDVQGVMLMKLIDRETGNSSYELIKEFKGGLMAVFYQSLGKLFGFNLKVTYDPGGEDKDIEQIVLMIESGQL